MYTKSIRYVSLHKTTLMSPAGRLIDSMLYTDSIQFYNDMYLIVIINYCYIIIVIVILFYRVFSSHPGT